MTPPGQSIPEHPESLPYERELGGARALIYDLRARMEDPDASLVVDATARLAEWLIPNAKSDRHEPLTVVLIDPDDAGPALAPSVEALYASLRVMVNSVALERPRTHLTTIRVDSGSLSALEDTVAYLAKPAGAFVTAASIDVRSAA
ncbi:hypothetical protein [Leucobacter celer]|uniref:hypothetical protein n=1 Tax=Leucobacter celer TaxID=668625 RepID=UPI0006A7B1A5|nr:hypothetical protein [Leucobacter celer]